MRAWDEDLDTVQECSWDCDGMFTYKRKIRNGHEVLAIFNQISTKNRI
jgi:hypothetical protein